VAALPFPQTHYVPQRLRGIHRQRLESVGLWGLGGVHAGDAVDEDRKRLEDSFVVAPGGTKTERKWSGWNAGREAAERSRTFGEEKIRVRAQTAFQPIARKLGSDKFFFGRR
jgi:sorting and assembly machinery component 37